MLSIPLIKCDDQVLNGIVKQKNMDNQVLNGIIKEIDYDNDIQLSQIGRKNEEKVNKIDTEIKTEIDFVESYDFEGTVLNKSNCSEFIACMNLDLTSNCHWDT